MSGFCPTLINLSFRAPLYAMRATLVHCECLVSRGYYLSAASWFIKMTNDEADLNSGLLLEQVHYVICLLERLKKWLRKPLVFRNFYWLKPWSNIIQRTIPTPPIQYILVLIYSCVTKNDIQGAHIYLFKFSLL